MRDKKDQSGTKAKLAVFSLSEIKQAADQARLRNEHDVAIAHYSQALDLLRSEVMGSEARTIEEYDLLAERAECYGQLGNLQAQVTDLEAMAQLAQKMGDVIKQIETINRQVDVANRLGKSAEAQQAAETAVALARDASERKLEADSLTALGQTCYNLSDYARAQECHEAALAIYRELGDRSGEAHNLWDLGSLAVVAGKSTEAIDYLEAALTLYHDLGERTGEANVLNMLGHTSSDYAQRRSYYEQALAIYHAIGNPEREVVVYNNLALVYWSLGLYGRASDYAGRAVQISRDMQARYLLSNTLDALGRAYLGMGAYDQAKPVLDEGLALSREIGDRWSESFYTLMLGWEALARKQLEEAKKRFEDSGKLFDELGMAAEQATALAWLGEVHLALDKWPAAHGYTSKATAQMDAVDATGEYPAQEVWWLHYRVLTGGRDRRSDGSVLDDDAWSYLDQSRETLMSGIATISDEGLRRNYLNKVPINRDIVDEWTRQAIRRGVPLTALTEVARAGNIEDQLKRMLDIGVRLTSRGEARTLPKFIMDEIVELSGAERAFLVLLDETGEIERGELAASSGIAPEAMETLRMQAAPVLSKVANSLQPVLWQDMGDNMVQKDGDVPELALRSVMGIPMISRSQLMGMIYADMRIINGHFAQADVDLLTVLANQGAAALENAAWARTLEQRVAHRTAELTTINSISQDLVSELDLNAVLELVGEKIREIFDVETVYLALYDPGNARVNFGYNYYQGQRFHDLSIKYGEGLVSRVIETAQPLLINENVAQRYAELNAETSETRAKSYLSVPITVSDSASKTGQRVIGVISVQSTEQEGLFDEADMRLLTTIAANVGVAIEKAHLFEETKQAREIAEATAQELSQTLDHLRATQSQLVESEKMAALGHLIAGIAHEINTPLGAIGASIGNIADDLGELVKRMPQMFHQILPEQQQDFFSLIERASQVRHMLTSREERQLRRSLRRELEDREINEADFIAEILVDMGIHDDIEAFLPLLRSENIVFILQAAQNMVNPQTSSQTIQMAVDRASKVVFALKRYAHQDASGQMIEANIIDGIEDVLTLYHSHLKRGVEVTKDYDDVPQIYCQPDELNQVWTNLIHNALQAMDYRGNLGIEVRRLENGDKRLGDEQSSNLQSATSNYLAVSISDSGAGIPDEIRDRIFDPFFTTKAAGEGSGLGLDIVRKIIEQHGGAIDFESQPGRTTFRVLLPMNRA